MAGNRDAGAGLNMDISYLNHDRVEQALAKYPREMPRLIVRVTNRATASGRTVMVREVARDMRMKQKDVRDSMPYREATLANPTARLAASLKRIPVWKLGAKGPYPSRGRGSVRFQGKVIPGAFVGRMKSGHEGVFVRKGDARLPIRELFGASIGRVFAKYRPQTLVRINEAWKTNFDHEYQRLVSRVGAD